MRAQFDVHYKSSSEEVCVPGYGFEIVEHHVVAFSDGDVDRSEPVFVLDGGIGAGFHEQAADIELLVLDGEVKRRVAEAVGGVHLRLVLEQQPHVVDHLGAHRVVQRVGDVVLHVRQDGLVLQQVHEDLLLGQLAGQVHDVRLLLHPHLAQRELQQLVALEVRVEHCLVDRRELVQVQDAWVSLLREQLFHDLGVTSNSRKMKGSVALVVLLVEVELI